tara:strand:+ start:764 stop:1090 length:327 start_codon:yes stop_codon:yes gene_type:complete
LLSVSPRSGFQLHNSLLAPGFTDGSAMAHTNEKFQSFGFLRNKKLVFQEWLRRSLMIHDHLGSAGWNTDDFFSPEWGDTSMEIYNFLKINFLDHDFIPADVLPHHFSH